MENSQIGALTKSLSELVPRWEWRTFELTYPEAEKVFKEQAIENIIKTEETYFVSELSNDNPKIRFDLLDLKLPLSINRTNLELWTVAMKAAFPVSISQLAILYKALGISLPKDPKLYYTYPEFLDLMAKEKTIHPVTVSKKRYKFKINNIRSEISRLWIQGKEYATVSFEDADENNVRSMVEMHKLTDYPNLNYIKMLKSHLGLPYKFC